jgi:two-component system, sensor histidine kinase and response regulator
MKNKDFTILVADDNTENLRMVSSILLAEGYKLALVHDGEGVMKITEENKIDLILLDILMPGSLNGFQVCRSLKNSTKTKDIPVIFLSAKSDGEDIIEGFKIGGADFIAKPFNKEELLARVSNHIRLKFLLDELNARIKYLEHSRADFMKWLHGLANSIEPTK